MALVPGRYWAPKGPGEVWSLRVWTAQEASNLYDLPPPARRDQPQGWSLAAVSFTADTTDIVAESMHNDWHDRAVELGLADVQWRRRAGPSWDEVMRAVAPAFRCRVAVWTDDDGQRFDGCGEGPTRGDAEDKALEAVPAHLHHMVWEAIREARIQRDDAATVDRRDWWAMAEVWSPR